MKSRIILLWFSLVVISTALFSENSNNSDTSLKQEVLTIFCPPALENIANEILTEYSRTASVRIDENIKENIGSLLLKPSSLALVPERYLQANQLQNFWRLSIAREVVVPVINIHHSFYDQLIIQGVSPERLSLAIQNDSINWNYIIDNVDSKGFDIFIEDNYVVKERLSNFLELESITKAADVLNTEALIASLNENPNAIAFCKLSSLVDEKNAFKNENIAFVPIDKNSNGKVDFIEDIYKNVQTLERGVWLRKYPHVLVTDYMIVSSGHPQSKNEQLFLSWLLTDGQNKILELSYTRLNINEAYSAMDKVVQYPVIIKETPRSYANLKAILLIAALIIMLLVLVDLTFFRWKRKLQKKVVKYNKKGIASNAEITTPVGYYYDKTYTWAFMEQNGLVKIGINDFIPSITGVLTGVVLKNEGETISKGKSLFSIIQEGKKLNIKAPVSGKILKQNIKIKQDASLLNFSPYSEGWIYMIEPKNWVREIQFMLTVDIFKEWLKSEYLRLKDIFSIILSKNTMQGAIILQEGGELEKSILQKEDPKVWEDFQQHFIDAIL